MRQMTHMPCIIETYQYSEEEEKNNDLVDLHIYLFHRLFTD